ncbi:hypothetical protein GCM10011512_04710 [Tersicoccus solisilvae]|uniref:Pilus assembly protein TadE n=1 Tax=Tersicoccus solisilvae TaxID=1882339 RepID=A0ABQ1NMP5_9MICC|nr:TadE family type IV pilus minor pilin [Tersicoccus solisilvae]GGC81007.1 hypothetical protein GCM10011512_04710 [Tersicoccus solisilvae]
MLASRARGDRGAVTAELAVALPAVVLVLGLLVTGAAAGTAQVRAEGAARAAVRALARGESEGVARGLAGQQAGPDARVSVGADGPLVRVRVEQRVPVVAGVVLPLTVVAEATGLRETGNAAGPRSRPTPPRPAFAAGSGRTVGI